MAKKMNQGAALNTRIWTLFEKAGFQTMPNSQSPKEFEVHHSSKQRPLDLYATDSNLGVTIVGSNKSGKISGGWSAHINDFRTIANKAKADAALLIVTSIEPSTVDMQFASSQNITVWTEEQIGYFEAMVDSHKTIREIRDNTQPWSLKRPYRHQLPNCR